ncbi:hypothetical protein LTR94_029669, partial [Friedmanniomyces endolithicus]
QAGLGLLPRVRDPGCAGRLVAGRQAAPQAERRPEREAVRPGGRGRGHDLRFRHADRPCREARKAGRRRLSDGRDRIASRRHTTSGDRAQGGGARRVAPAGCGRCPGRLARLARRPPARSRQRRLSPERGHAGGMAARPQDRCDRRQRPAGPALRSPGRLSSCAGRRVHRAAGGLSLRLSRLECARGRRPPAEDAADAAGQAARRPPRASQPDDAAARRRLSSRRAA